MPFAVLSEPAVEALAQLFRLLGEPNRVRILCSLGMECRPVTDVIRATGLEQTNASFHLRILREAGLVRAERRGPFVYYCLAHPDLLHMLRDLEQWLQSRRTPSARNDQETGRLMRPSSTTR
ncbi:MAG: metalloregulator ArsR/SmtB family transcription factor [Burkholderiales bacterium]|nr:winged helix-turn-helix transcriptional regulator [Burkholderiales bacterium]MBZ0251380.1 metalloregulator ArsR/SmtB family transcription factor [Burkholderiales bacterium]MCC6142608.1 winged helix-turn-helix transcriptional regulator [Candidatus Hydrogenedentota bacterium]